MKFECFIPFQNWKNPLNYVGFPGNSAGKESACNAGDPGLIPGWGRSARERISYPLQYSWASLVAQLVKSLPAVWETQVEKGTGLENSMDCMYSPWGHKESDTTERLSLSAFTFLKDITMKKKKNPTPKSQGILNSLHKVLEGIW